MGADETVNLGAGSQLPAAPSHDTPSADSNRSSAGTARVLGAPHPSVPPTQAIEVAPDVARHVRAARAAPLCVPGYEVDREIARGGMGMVLAARDPKLGRDVAIKVLLPGNGRVADAARRFVQESKITARLPHPGIPPVYELGTLPDGNPFLVMKLVRGRTLAAELARADTAADLPRLVQIFEQVAQAVGFAHSQSVIHRDLKPANVMVGAFGEALVMDWGIAKEVGNPQSGAWVFGAGPPAGPAPAGDEGPVRTEAGRALGTPAYMAPEQARGEPLGPPTDVFALGGILCAILTGRPPFEGDTAHDTFRIAARGDVGSAFARLSASGADPELVALCKQLLAPRASDRPADGKAVADAVAAYRAGVDRRLRGAEAERARSAELRKRRRVQLALTATVLAFAALAGTGAWWQDRQAAAARLAEERRVHGERERAARAAVALDSVLARGEERVRQGDADRAEELVRRAEELLTHEARAGADGEPDSAGRVARLRSELGVLKDLNRIHDLEWAVVRGAHTNKEQLVAAWSAVFRPLGFEGSNPPTDGAVNGVRGAIAREPLLRALEGWFWTVPSDATLALLRAADPDDYRNAVRVALRAANVPRLAELAGSPELLRQPARFALMFAREPGLTPAQRDRILRAVYLREPNDFHVLMDLATVRPNEAPEHTRERVGWYRAALAVRPNNVPAWNNLGNAFHTLGRYTEATTAYREALRLDPTFAVAHSNLVGTLRDSGDLPGALATARAAVRLDPRSATAHNNLANVLQDAGDLPAAVAAFKDAVRLKPDFALAYSNMASALCALGDTRGAIAACKAAVLLNPSDVGALSNLGSALRAEGDARGALATYKEAVRLAPRYAPGHFNLGNVLCDLGDLAGACAAYREAIRIDPAFASAHAALGRVLRDVNDLPAAIAAYREAIRLDPKHAPAHHALGMALRADGNLTGAIASYREAIRLDRSFAPAQNSLGLALKAAGDLDGAKAALREAIRIDPKFVPAYNNLGLVLKASGDLDGAIGSYRQAVQLNPRDGLAHYNMGLALAAKNDLPAAIEAFRGAVRLRPEMLLARASLAHALQDSGNLSAAITEYREAARLFPRDAGARAALGRALLKSGDATGGREALAQAARLDPKQFEPLFRQQFPAPVAPAPRAVPQH